MARSIKNKALATIAAAAALTFATATGVHAQEITPTDTVTVATITTAATTGLDALLTEQGAPAAQAQAAHNTTETQTETEVEAEVEAGNTEQAQAHGEAPAPAHTVPATAIDQAASAPAQTAGPVIIDVNCQGTQEEIDTCVGATNYTPVADYLGVPYYAQHNGMGGEAWLNLHTGDQVTADGITYTITEIRTVTTGGDIDQIAGMGADAYLQTCLDDNIHSKVFALHTN